MIFVTVGTTMPFDGLLEAMDRLAGAGLLPEPLVCQTGQSSYRMVHAKHFRALPNIEDHVQRASLVVTHGGATVIQLLMLRKPFVSVSNPISAGGHQASFLKQVATVADISWTDDLSELQAMIPDRLARGPAVVRTGLPRAADLIRSGLKRPGQRTTP